MMENRPIGIFDSGIGGLSVLSEVRKALPKEGLIYLGDTARTPYGPKSAETIIKYSEEALDFLLCHNVKLVVIACNTVSSVAAGRLRDRFSHIIDVIRPAVYSAIKSTKSRKIGVIGTERTIKSFVYQRELKMADPEIEVFAKACPLFVPLVEEGWTEHSVTKQVAEEYLSELKGRIDTLILGCTHYPFLSKIISESVGGSVKLITSSSACAEAVLCFLKERDLLSEGDGRIELYTTDTPEKFIDIGCRLLDLEIEDVRRVVL
jgi:glutamate racemase